MTQKKPTLPWEELARQSQQLRKRLESLTAQIEVAGETKPEDPISLLDVLCRETASWEDVAAKATRTMHQQMERIKGRRECYAEELSDLLKRTLSSKGHKVHGEAGTLIVDGIVYLEIDLQNGKARVNGFLQKDLSHEGIVASVLDEAKQLQKSVTSPAEFGRLLLCAYRAVLAARGLQPPSQVMTLDLLPQVVIQKQDSRFISDPSSRNFKEYPLVQFRADMFALLSSGKLSFDGMTFHWASGSNTKGAVFMLAPGLGRPAHVGRVWFEPSKE